MRKTIIWAGNLLVLLVLLCGCAWRMNEEIPEYVLTYAENQPANYPTTQGALKFAELVQERTNHKIRIQVHCDGELGTEQEVVSQMKFGGIDFARISLASISDQIPQLNVLQLPFLYDDADHMWRVLNGVLGEVFLNSFKEADLIGLSWYDAGARSFYSNQEIHTQEDLAGMKIRVQDSDMMQDMISRLGATPVSVPYSDVYVAFHTGKIDAAENNWPAYEARRHYDVAKYFTVDEHTRVPEIQLASGETWRSLSEEYQDIILECARESAEYEKQLWAEREKTARKKAIEKGCVELRMSNAELWKFRETALSIYETYCSDYMDIIERIQREGARGTED